MNAHVALELRKSIRNALLADPGFAASPAAGRVFDETPPGVALPYVTLANASVRDWSTATEDGALHSLTLDIWSEHRGVAVALNLAAIAAAALDEAPLAVTGHALVSLSVQTVETLRDARGRYARARVRLRAVTEPL